MNKPYVFSFVMFMSRHLDRQQSISGLIVVPSRILGTGKLGPEVQSCPMSVFINKVLLEHSHAHWLINFGCFQAAIELTDMQS